MVTTLLEESKHLNSQASELSTTPALTTKFRRNRLVARWLMDKDFKLSCQWVIEN
ncbi:hypothetical protein IFO70_37125 [Phormidium tenue FACHB-886]|nr:hypothetical protein [Phormidium tenue FACHB-886]